MSAATRYNSGTQASAKTEPAPPPAELDAGKWLEEGLRNREALRAELDRLKARAAQLETALKLLESLPGPSAQTYSIAVEGTTLDWLRACLRTEPGLNASQLRQALAKHGREVSSDRVHTYLFRLMARGEARAEGAKGSQRYFAVERP